MVSKREIFTAIPLLSQAERSARWHELLGSQTEDAGKENCAAQTMPHTAVVPSNVQKEKRQTWGPQTPEQAARIAANLVYSSQDVHQRFAEMLSSIDMPDAIREKMLNLDIPTKYGMLSKQQALIDKDLPPSPTKSKRITAPILKKARSYVSPRNCSGTPLAQNDSGTANETPDGFVLVTPKLCPSSPIKRVRKNSAISAADKFDGDSAAQWAMLIQTSTRSTLLPGQLVKLRMLLRNESTAWLDSFIKYQGPKGVRDRLAELIKLEWREEQRDDTLLLELLKCWKALLHTEIGRAAIAKEFPQPLMELVRLLYSDKKPGDLASRQIIFELVLGLANVFDSRSCPLPPSSQEWEALGIHDRLACIGETNSVHKLVKHVLMGPIDEREEARVDFIKDSHRSRPFKRWLTEWSGVLSDFFWIFCHTHQLFKTFQNLDVSKMSTPVVPAGHSGGVEAEAMAYAVVCMRLLNFLAATCAPGDAALLHQELFDSGLEKILSALRKCNIVYYPEVHLELSRYMYLLQKTSFLLPYRLERYLEVNCGTSSGERTEEQQKRRTATEPSSYLPDLRF